MHRRNQVSKYLKTKPGSLESAVLEAVSPAQQAAIAISKKEKGEKPKEKNEEKVECPQCKGEGCDHCDGKGYHTTEELSAKQKKIDLNKNGKVDGDDLKKLRAKAQKDEEVQVNEKVEYVEYKFRNRRDAEKALDYIDAQQLMSFDVNDDDLHNGHLTVDAGNKDMTKYHNEIMKKFRPKVVTQERKEEVKEGTYVGDTGMVERAAKHISDMWKDASNSKSEEEEKPKAKKETKTTMTGKPMSNVEVTPKDKEEK